MKRLQLYDAIHFLTVSTYRCQRILSDKEKQLVFDQIERVVAIFKLKIFAYSIVSNHYHLVFYLENGDNRGRIIQLINGGSAYRINEVIKRDLPIWGKKWLRYISNEKSFSDITNYVHGNPLKHGAVKSLIELERYNFCSYKSFVQTAGREFAQNMVGSAIKCNRFGNI